MCRVNAEIRACRRKFAERHIINFYEAAFTEKINSFIETHNSIGGYLTYIHRVNFLKKIEKLNNMKKIYLYAFVLALVFVIGKDTKAQDIHFSQFYMSPLTLNPAMTGVMDCTDRITFNYRNQWAGVAKNYAYNTIGASYDKKFTAFRRDYWGLGINLFGDRAGASRFTTSAVGLSGSFSKYLGGNRNFSNYLVFGAELGFGNRFFSMDELRFPIQHDGRGGWANISHGEILFDDTSIFYGDVNAGLLWFMNWHNAGSFYIGGAYSHINKPNQSFASDATGSKAVLLYSKYTLHTGGEFPIGASASLVPGIVTFLQGPSWQLNGGTAVRFNIGSQRFQTQNFQVGAWARLVNNYTYNISEDLLPEVDYRLGLDAIIGSVRFQYNEFTVGFSYDANVSPLNKGTSGNGAFELMLMYEFCGPEQRGVYCPSF